MSEFCTVSVCAVDAARGRPPQQLTYHHFRVGALGQLGGYDQRNNAESAYQFGLGGDVGALSVDAIYAYAKDAVTLSNYTSGAPTPVTLKATLANVSAEVVAASYKWRQLDRVRRLRIRAPEFAERPVRRDGDGEWPNPHPKRRLPCRGSSQYLCESESLQVAWVAGKYSILSNLDLDAGYYYIEQNNYANAATKYNTAAAARRRVSAAART